jgi:hypothetical protein
MSQLVLGAVLGLVLVLVPGLAIGLATQPVVLAFVLGVAARPALARRVRRWAL